MSGKEDLIVDIEKQMKILQNKKDLVMNLDIGKIYKVTLDISRDKSFFVCIPTKYNINTILTLLLAHEKKKGFHKRRGNYVEISYEIIKTIERIYPEDLPLFINEWTTPVFKHIISGKPYLKEDGTPMEFPDEGIFWSEK